MNAAEAAKILDASVQGSGPFNVSCPVCDKPSLAIFDVGTGAAEFMCGNGCTNEAIKAGIEIASGHKPKPNMGWIEKFKLTEAEVDELVDPEWIYENLIIKGHLILNPADPGAGKTTIMLDVAGEIAGDYEVIYVNADVGCGDVKAMQAQADERGFHLLLPDMKAGLSMDDVVNRVISMNQIDANYSNIVFIFDTLKKMTDVINKTRAKELLKTLRGLTAKGMTIILLAHTNKYTDADGHPIYEGTGDLRSDVDDLIYFIPKKNEDGSMTVSTDPISLTAKRRGTHQPITFRISANREVSRTDVYVDTAAQVKTEKQMEQDKTIIEAVTEAIESGKFKRTEIVSYCSHAEIAGRKSVEAVLRRHEGKLWTCTKGFQKNAWIYALIDKGTPAANGTEGQTNKQYKPYKHNRENG